MCISGCLDICTCMTCMKESVEGSSSPGTGVTGNETPCELRGTKYGNSE